MSDIELVIKIPEELYETYKGRPPMLGDAGMDMISQAIANGTPLPKGHGNLVDVEDVKNNIISWRGYLDKDMMRRINFSMNNHIPTIINADNKEG